ncbi:MAG: hypothetical protein GIW97_08655 [Candidatus Eremiobacteraeota bacterium]|nr:hypothetical protein [Candidatus Eremiobacteraeota bacterium]
MGLIGAELLSLARKAGAKSIAVVGTGKNVGKTVVVATICDALRAEGTPYGLTSIGRDGEAVDVADALAKPRLLLHPGAVIATARGVLPAAPAAQILDLSALASAAGEIVYAGVRQSAFYEIAGPPTASGIRASVRRLFELDAKFVVLDGAVDRIAALAGEQHAVVVAAGASNSGTPAEAVAEVRALVARLQIPKADPAAPALVIDGALAPSTVAKLIAAGETRQIVVRDPTQVAVRGKAFLALSTHLQLRCERPLVVIAVTVASIGRDRYFEPRAFLEEVASATGLPAFDSYAGKMVAA